MDREKEYKDVVEKLKEVMDESDIVMAITGSKATISGIAMVGGKIESIKILVEAFSESEELYKVFKYAVKIYEHIKEIKEKEGNVPNCDTCESKEECDIVNGIESIASNVLQTDHLTTPEDVLNKIMSTTRPKGKC